ncbi:ankyrin repeat domain-containing protein, partial [Myxococcota bacterium]|nr:ankyrin repeat domain-containing protein [Myxococcota bacterium]
LIALVEMLIGLGADVHAENNRGNTPLHYAAVDGHVETVRALVKLGATIDTDGRGMTLQGAAERGHAESVAVLLELGAEISARDYNGDTALHSAAGAGRTRVAHLLIKSGADVSARNEKGHTPLHSVVDIWSEDWLGMQEVLIKLGADPNAQDEDGNTPLHLLAAKYRKEKTPELLVKLGADLEIKNNEGKTALYLAAQSGQTQRVDLLIKLGADETCLHVNKDRDVTPETTLEDLIMSMEFTTHLKLGKYSDWALRLNAEQLAALFWAIGIFGCEMSITNSPGGFFSEEQREELYGGTLRKLSALDRLAEIQQAGGLGGSGAFGWLNQYPVGTPAFASAYRNYLLEDEYTGWAQALDERSIALVLWMVGEYGIRGGWYRSAGEGDAVYSQRAAIALSFITSIYFGKNANVEGLRGVLQEMLET